MSVFAHLDGLGTLQEECVCDALLAWRDEHPRYRYAEDLIAQYVASVQVTTTLRGSGIAMISVQIEAKRSPDSCVHFFRVKRLGSGQWMCTASSVSKP